MSHEVAQSNPVQVKKRSRSWFQFSLRTFLILTIVVAGILSQAASEIATARKKSQAIARLKAGGYHAILYDQDISRRRWVTSFVTPSQWDEWFSYGDCDRLDQVVQYKPVTPQDVLSRREMFQLLNAFESCPEVELSFDGPRDAISATDISTFRGWKQIESLKLDRGAPDNSALKMLATSEKLLRLRIARTEIPRSTLMEFLNDSSIKELKLDGVRLIEDTPWRLPNSLKDAAIYHGDTSWDEVGELLDNSQLKRLCVWLDSNQTPTRRWNSCSLEKLIIAGPYDRDLDLLGDLPVLRSIELRGIDELNVEAIGRLSRYSCLTELEYNGRIKPSIIQEIANIRSLRDLELFGDDDSAFSLKEISSLENLESCFVSIRVTQEDVAVLRDLPRLKNISFRGYQHLDTMRTLLDSRSLRKLDFSVEEDLRPLVDDFSRLARERGIQVGVQIGVFTSNFTGFLENETLPASP